MYKECEFQCALACMFVFNLHGLFLSQISRTFCISIKSKLGKTYFDFLIRIVLPARKNLIIPPKNPPKTTGETKTLTTKQEDN